MSSHEKKTYVVYNGYQTGVYNNWIDSYAQAYGYKDCVVRLYDNAAEGSNAWTAYKNKYPSSFQKKIVIEEAISQDSGYYNDIISNIIQRREEAEIYPDKLANTNVIKIISMQDWLKETCLRLHIEEPLYVLHNHKYDVDGNRHYRYRAYLYLHKIGKPRSCLGDFARTKEKALENVAVMLLRRLLSSCDLKIVDYDHYNVELLEEQLNQLAQNNYDLQVENTALLGELKILHSSLVANEKKITEE